MHWPLVLRRETDTLGERRNLAGLDDLVVHSGRFPIDKESLVRLRSRLRRGVPP
jgi:hypothetical protein